MLRGMISWALGVCVFLGVGAAVGQVTTGTISGTVSDSTGALVPGATIGIKNIDTGASRTATTDGAGRYGAPQLAVGNYEVTAEAAGFQTVVRRGIALTVGREALVDFSLQVGTVAEQITVTGEAPLVDATTSSISGSVNQAQMRDLPLNARSYEQLALLSPNVRRQRNVFHTAYSGYAPEITAAGMRPLHNAYVMDGIDIADHSSSTPGSAAGQLMGVETLREFRVLTNNAKAEYGRAIGGTIDVTSRSGTNEFHGTVFEFLRNDKSDARSFFDPAKPPFRRNQFGAVLGGPIVKDRAFFFASYEALRERLTTTNTVFVPTDQAKQGILPDPADPTKTVTIPVDPAIRPFLAFYPSPQQNVGAGIGAYTFPFKGSVREDFVSGRVDYQHSDKVSYFGRFSWDSTDKLQRRGPAVIPPWAEGLRSRNPTIILAETRLLSPQLINEFRAGFVRYTPQSRNALTGPDPQIQFPGTVGQGIIALSTGFSAAGIGLANVGTTGRSFETNYSNTFQVVDNLSYVVGAHSIKTGGNIERFQDNLVNLAETGLYRYSSTYTFQSLPDLLTATPISFAGSQVPQTLAISGRQWLFGFYVQDDYRWRPNFTLNLGLRYEFASNYANNNNRFMLLNDLFGTPKTQQKYAWEGRVCAGCVEPRFGFAWDIFSNQKSVLKGGFGMFHSQIVRYHAHFPVTSETPGGINIAVDRPSFPDPAVPKPGAVIRITQTGTASAGVAKFSPRIPSTPTALHWNLTVEQQITPSMTMRAAYVGSRGYHLQGGYGVNTNTYEIRPDGSIFFSPVLRRIRPEWGAVTYNAWDNNSYYNALTLTVGQRMSHGLGFEVSYAFSRATDDTTLESTGAAQLQTEMRSADGRRNVHHGLSALDMRHRGIANFTYDLPSLAAQGGFAGKVLSGWQLGSIITLEAGIPISPLVGFDRARQFGTGPDSQRVSLSPDLKGPVPICPCQLPASLGGNQQSPQRYFDPTAFVLPEAGTYGNAGRNIITAPGVMTFDFALVKNTSLTERLKLQFRAEGFNILNNVNWAPPNPRIFDSRGAIVGSAGAITSTSTTGRQLQFALKLLF